MPALVAAGSSRWQQQDDMEGYDDVREEAGFSEEEEKDAADEGFQGTMY